MDEEKIYKTLEEIATHFEIELRGARINFTPNESYAGVVSKVYLDKKTNTRFVDSQTIFFLPKHYLDSEEKTRGFFAHEFSHVDLGENFSQKSRRWALRMSDKFGSSYGKFSAFPFALYCYAMEKKVDKNAEKKGLGKEINDLRENAPICFWPIVD